MKKLRLALAGAAVLFVIAQMVPYGHAHLNPTVRHEPAWGTPEIRALAQSACFDCHSNETRWPWYSSVAPVSWMVQHDVNAGRSALNFSQWPVRQEDAEEAPKTVRTGEMPPRYYTLIHSEARLTEAERNALADALASIAGRGNEQARR